MKVRLCDEIFRHPTNKSDVSYLIKTIIRRRHSISIVSDVSADISWLDPSDIQVIEDSIAASLIGDMEEPDCKVINNAGNIHRDKTFSVNEAITYVATPLEIVLENGTNDSPLTLACIRSYLQSGSYAVSAYHDLRLVFATGGGCTNVRNYLEGKVAQHGERPKFLRHFVILDGDRRYEGHDISKYDSLIAYLRSINVKFHILEKRCMENYLPVDCFPAADKNREWLNAFNALTPRQRDFFNIGGGFRGDVPEGRKKEIDSSGGNIKSLLPQEQQDFYSDVTDTNFTTLSKGYDLPSFKKSFPKGFDDGKTNQTSLNALLQHQDNPDELKDLASTIQKLL